MTAQNRQRIKDFSVLPELSVNGELSPESPAGFSKIVLHLKEEQHIEVEGSTIVVRDKQSIGHHTGDEVLTVGRCCVLISPAGHV